MDDKMRVTHIAAMDNQGKVRTAEMSLPGGKAGQMLVKASDIDGDVEWVDPITMEDVQQAVETGVSGAMGNIGAVLDAINGEVI